MPDAAKMPLQEVLQALSRTPVTEPQLRAALATTCARWHLLRGEQDEAIRQLGHALEMVPDLRPAMRLLYRVYLDRNDVRAAVTYLDQEIRATRHPREAAALYRERGLLVEAHFNDLAAAEQCYRAALKATPSDLAVLRSVERVCLARGDVFALIANLESQLEVVEDQTAAAGILHDLALIESRHQGDLALAGDLLLEALARLGGHLVLIRDLFRVAEIAGDSELLLRALEFEAESARPSERAFALARASISLQAHEELDAAIAVLLVAASDRPALVSIWRTLEELSLRSERHEVALEAGVGRLTAARTAHEDDPALVAELYYRVGRLALGRAGRAADGLAAMRKALRLRPGHPLAVLDTANFLERNGLWAQRLELAKVEVSLGDGTPQGRRRAALAQVRAGIVMESSLDELDGARRAFEEALALDPECQPARDRLERTLHRIGDLDALKTFYENELERTISAPRRVFLHSMLGYLHAGDEDPSPAIRWFQALLADRPGHLPSMQLLGRLLARTDRREELLRLTVEEMDLTGMGPRQAKLCHRAGELALEQGMPAQARQFFSQALDAVDDHMPTLESLGTLLQRQGDWSAAAQVLRKRLLYARDRASQVSLQFELAAMLADTLQRPDDALTELEDVLERWPTHLPALHFGERLAAAQSRHELHARLLSRHIRGTRGPRTRALLLLRRARIVARLGDVGAATDDLVVALDAWPALSAAKYELLQLHRRAGSWDELASLRAVGTFDGLGIEDAQALARALATSSADPLDAVRELGHVAKERPGDPVVALELAWAAYSAEQPARQAAATLAAHDASFTGQEVACPAAVALRYEAARAYETARHDREAAALYAAIEDVQPGNPLATRGRARLAQRMQTERPPSSAEEFEAAANAAHSPAAHAALMTIAAEQLERHDDLRGALRRIDSALERCPPYLPALHARARVLEQMGGDGHLFDAIEALEAIAARVRTPVHRARVLCRAGTLALRVVDEEESNPRAWSHFTEALSVDPSSAHAVAGLVQTCRAHGPKGAPDLGDVLLSRVRAQLARGELTAEEVVDLARVGLAVHGPTCARTLLESGLAASLDDAFLWAELGQAHACLGDWPQAVVALANAIDRVDSDEHRATLHFYLAESNERSDQPREAAKHYLEAGRGRFHPQHAFLAAARIGAEIGEHELRASALHELVEIRDGTAKLGPLRDLARLYEGPLAKPERAVDLLREASARSPADADLLLDLRRLLLTLERGEEARAVLLGGIADFRAALARGAVGADDLRNAIRGLVRLFDASGRADAVYVAGRVLGQLDSDAAPPIDGPLHWTLPRPPQSRPVDGLFADLPAAAALMLLKEGAYCLGDAPIPGVPPLADLAVSRPLSPEHPAVATVRTLADMLKINPPLVRIGDDPGEIEAIASPSPCLVIGRDLAEDPLHPTSRDGLGRALLRLALGGDRLLAPARSLSLWTVLCGLSAAVGEVLDPDTPVDAGFVASLRQRLPTHPESLEEMRSAAGRLRRVAADVFPRALQESIVMAQDRAGALCAADPSASLDQIGDEHDLPRLRAIVAYLVSEVHLSTRTAVGYELQPAPAPPAQRAHA